MNLCHHLSALQLGHPAASREDRRFDVALDKYRSRSLEDQPSGPLLSMCLRTSGSGRSRRLLVATETGMVRLMDPDRFTVVNEWCSHRNAVFDIKWRPGHNHCLTASGDTSFSLWDVDSVKRSDNPEDNSPLRRQKEAHMSTLKSVSFMDENVVATGARDGAIIMWDLRLPVDSHVRMIPDAHHDWDGMHSAKKTKSAKKKNSIVRSDPATSITGLLFQPHSHILYSAGTTGGLIKVWDIRMIRHSPVPKKTIPPTGNGSSGTPPPKSKSKVPAIPTCQPVRVMGWGRHSSCHGFTSLAFDSQYNVLGSCSDHRVYSFDRISGEPLATYSASCYRTDVFSKISVWENLLVSGSVGGSCPVWRMTDARNQDPEYVPDVKPRVILSHDVDTASVEADPVTGNIFSLSDDYRVNQWSLFHDVGKRSSDCPDPSVSSVDAERRAIPYQDEHLEVEELRRTARRSFLTVVKSESSSTATASPTAQLLLARTSCLPLTPVSVKKESPAPSVLNWLSPSPAEHEASGSSSSSSAAAAAAKAKKRSHTDAKENLSNLMNRIELASPSERQQRPCPSPATTPGRKRVKKEKKEISSRKIYTYFTA